MSNSDRLGKTARENPLGEYLKRVIEKRNIKLKVLAEELGVSRQTMSGLVNGKIPLSNVMALRLSAFFGNTPESWLKFQDQQLQEIAPMQASERLDDFKDPFLRELQKIGYHPLVDHEILKAHQSGILGIENFSKDSVQSASYDLRIRKVIVSHSNKKEEGGNNGELNSQLPASMPPGATAVVQSYEKFLFPIFFLGHLGGMSELASQGIKVIYGLQIDPGFRGFIYATLKNVGNSDYELRYKDRFMTLEILFLPVVPNRPYEGENLDRTGFSNKERDTIMAKKDDKLRKIREVFEIFEDLLREER